MQVYSCTNFVDHYPVGTCAIVVAENRVQARQMIKDHLAKSPTPQEDDWEPKLEPVYTGTPGVTVLLDGNY